MSGMINYCWRLVASLFSFIVFGVGGLLLAVTVFPLLFLLIQNEAERTRSARLVIHNSFRFFVYMIQFFGIFNFDIKQAEKQLANYRGKIIIANHPSLIDVVVLISILPQADCIVKKALWNNFFLKGVVKAAGYIKNSQNADELMEACSQSLQAGYSLIIFPEGTRTRSSGKIELQRGASNIALRCGVDMIPVTICCQPSTLAKSEPWYSIPCKKPVFKVGTGKPVNVRKFIKSDQSMSISARRLTAYIENYFNEEVSSHA